MKYSYKYTTHAMAMAILYTNVFITIYLFLQNLSEKRKNLENHLGQLVKKSERFNLISSLKYNYDINLIIIILEIKPVQKGNFDNRVGFVNRFSPEPPHQKCQYLQN